MLLIGISAAGSLSAADLVESTDFSNFNPGTPYTLDVGSNTVSGNLSTPNDGRDQLNVTVPAGHRLVSASGSIGTTGLLSQSRSISFANTVLYSYSFDSFSIEINPLPASLPAGSYNLSAIVGTSTGTPWSTTFVVEKLPDYQITPNGSSLTISDESGNSDTLTVAAAASDPSKLLFSAPGRTFALTTGPQITGSSGNLDLSGITSITIQARDGDDIINVENLPSNFPRLSINGGDGDDTLNFSGTIDFAIDRDLSVNLTNEGFVVADQINVGAGAAITTTGDGDITLRCDQQVKVSGGATLTTANGRIRIEGNASTTPNPGTFTGVFIEGNSSGTLITSTGTGNIDITGRGGNAGFGQLGIQLSSGAQIIGGSGVVTVEGTGGSSPDRVNRGITLFGVGTKISSTGGDVVVTGTGGDSGVDFGIGVALFPNTEISALNGGDVTVTGIGRGPLGSNANYGIEMAGDEARIKTGGGNLVIVAVDEIGEEQGLVMNGTSSLQTPSTAGSIRIETTGLQLAATAIIEAGAPSGSVTLAPTNAIDNLHLGGFSASDRLDLTDAELDRFFTSNLVCESEVGTITIDGDISPAEVDRFIVAAIDGYVQQSFSGGSLSLVGKTFAIEGRFQQIFDDPTLLQPLVVNGELDLTQASLRAIGFEPLQEGDSFVLIENDASDTILGNFLGLPEGELLSFGNTSAHVAAISYLGGSGNDVTLTAPSIVQVANNNDSGPGSLRQALVDATSPAYIDFDSEFFTGGENNTITLTGQLTMPNKTLILDAQSAGGITLDGNQAGRVVSSFSGGTITLDGFSITGGRAANGGGVSNSTAGTTMTLLNCTIFGNTSTNAGGGIINLGGGTLLATNCTIFDNQADGFAGGIENNGSTSTMTLHNCTVVRNNSNGSGGGLSNNGGSITIGNTLIAHNTGASTPDIRYSAATSSSFTAPNLIRDNTGSSTAFPADSPNTDGNYVGDGTTPLEPLLVGDIGDNGPALINNGGPTPTILPLPGSPALGNGMLTDETPQLDQRGESRFGNPDIGATQPDWGELITVVAPPSAFADITDPTSSIQAFPADAPASPAGEGPEQTINNTSAKHFTFANINAGLDITPRIGAASIVGLSIQVSDETFTVNRDPKTFLLLGTNDDWNYIPVFSGEVPAFASRTTPQFFYRSIQSQPYRSYRLIFPNLRFQEDSNPFTEGLAIAEIELLGLPEDTDLRILDCKTTINVAGNHETLITYTSNPNRVYELSSGTTPVVSDPFQIFPSADSFISTYGAQTPITLKKAFFRIEELITE
ncbi:MAG: beta strand repeat-containing protein [Roseibacillus sp.]